MKFHFGVELLSQVETEIFLVLQIAEVLGQKLFAQQAEKTN